MKIKVDKQLMRRDIRKVNKRFQAVSDTLQNTGTGEVLTSKRKKMPHERASRKKGRKSQRVLHGRAIANILREQGRDPFVIHSQDEAQVYAIVDRGVLDAIDKAKKTSESQRDLVIEAITDGAEKMAEVAILRIEQGRLRPNRDGWKKRKSALMKPGIATSEYGTPPRPGVFTGRFIRGIRHRWRQGRLRRGS